MSGSVHGKESADWAKDLGDRNEAKVTARNVRSLTMTDDGKVERKLVFTTKLLKVLYQIALKPINSRDLSSDTAKLGRE